MDLAEAMLRPVDVDEASASRPGNARAGTYAGSWLAADEPFAELRTQKRLEQQPVHQRRRLRSPHTRRPGEVPAPAAACTTPLAEQRRTPQPSAAA